MIGTRKDSLSDDALLDLERRIQGGDVDAMRSYTADAFANHFDNRDELHRRRMLLSRIDTDVSTPLDCFALISAVMGDRNSWDLAIERLGDACDPGIGYLAWRLIIYHSKNQERADKWFHAVHHSAQLGHLPSRKQVLLHGLRQAGFIERLKLRLRLFALERERQRLESCEPSSRLLATFTDSAPSA